MRRTNSSPSSIFIITILIPLPYLSSRFEVFLPQVSLKCSPSFLVLKQILHSFSLTAKHSIMFIFIAVYNRPLSHRGPRPCTTLYIYVPIGTSSSIKYLNPIWVQHLILAIFLCPYPQ